MKSFQVFESPIGPLTLARQDDALTHLLFGRVELPGCEEKDAEPLRQAVSQLREYFAGTRRVFDVPLAPQGTAFQLRVWEALLEIPYGETRTYRDIAERVGCPKGYRAVGMANHHNPISILVPCHRVVGADGSLTGYGGGLHIKEKLLALEKSNLA